MREHLCRTLHVIAVHLLVSVWEGWRSVLQLPKERNARAYKTSKLFRKKGRQTFCLTARQHACLPQRQKERIFLQILTVFSITPAPLPILLDASFLLLKAY